MAGNNNSVIRYRKRINLNIGLIIFAVILIQITAAVVSYARTEHIRGYEVRSGSLSSVNTYVAVALRDENIVNAGNSGYINYYIREGTHAAKGDLVCTIDETGSIAEAASSVDVAEYSDEDLRTLKKDMEAFSESFREQSFSSVYDFKYTLSSVLMEIKTVSTLSDVSVLSDAGNGLIHYENAVDSGIVTYFTDGYESLTLEGMTPELMEGTDYEKKRIQNNDLVSSGDPIYKISNSERWSLVISTDRETADRMLDKEYVEVYFLKNGFSSWGEVKDFTDADGNVYVSMTFTNSMITFATERFVNIRLGIENEEGLKIPVSSIIESDFYIVPEAYMTKGAGGVSGVLRRKYDDKGTETVEFVQAPVYNTDGENAYLDQTILRTGDVIVKPESDETYTLAETGRLTGVYNINKGYAEFREITVIEQNEDYAIVKPNTTYGLSEYDFIVLDADSVRDDDLVYGGV
ncbi:MAG: hypothetical protein K6E33_08000 [Lachnospiraceae bacterium]|nr:hypothetical protein [Lachnospiraceae bacterium]